MLINKAKEPSVTYVLFVLTMIFSKKWVFFFQKVFFKRLFHFSIFSSKLK